MNVYQEDALEVASRLHREDRIDYSDYSTLYEGICEIVPLRDRDKKLEELWAQFEDVPMNPETNCIESQFMDWVPGTPRGDIWEWFDERHSKGVVHLLFLDSANRMAALARIMYLEEFCVECEADTCCYIYDGVCRFAMIHDRVPCIDDEDGCIDYKRKKYEEAI